MILFNEKRVLGRTGLKVGRLGVSSSFGAPAEAYEEAFERGANYFTWGTFIKGRSSGMKQAIQNISAKGVRDKLVLAMFTYAHNSYLTEKFFVSGLKKLGIEYADILLLGYFSKRPGKKLVDGALKLKEKGLIRHVGLSSHNRNLFPDIRDEFDLFHVRYNAAHRGAETETFPHLLGEDRPGVVSFTATRWRQLLSNKKMPKGEPPLTASECYRFALNHPVVDVCMMGAKNRIQMQENLSVLDSGPLSEDEMKRIVKIGDFVYGRKMSE